MAASSNARSCELMVLACLVTGVVLTLEGCGGREVATAFATTTTTTVIAATSPPKTHDATTFTTTSTVHRTPPRPAADILDLLNKQYMGFNPQDSNSPLGVTISMASNSTDFDSNIFCKPIKGSTQCFHGFADCRFSTSLYNHRILLHEDGKRPMMALGRLVGYVLNQTKVETLFSKCSYMFDGASQNRLNNGCGIGAGSNCSAEDSAFKNICPSTGKLCRVDDEDVRAAECMPYGPHEIPSGGNEEQCYFSGPALGFPGSKQPNHLRKMAIERLQHQVGEDPEKGPRISQWNEVVLDVRSLMPALIADPAEVITAFVFVKSNEQALDVATSMRNRFSDEYAVGAIPIIGIDDTKPFGPSGPFFIDDTPVAPAYAKCENHPECAFAGIKGECCPTNTGIMLGCCDAISKCDLHPKCMRDMPQVTGDCCPREDGTMFECCDNTNNSLVAPAPQKRSVNILA